MRNTGEATGGVDFSVLGVYNQVITAREKKIGEAVHQRIGIIGGELGSTTEKRLAAFNAPFTTGDEQMALQGKLEV